MKKYPGELRSCESAAVKGIPPRAIRLYGESKRKEIIMKTYGLVVLMVVAVTCSTVFADEDEAIGTHEDGWILHLYCPAEVKHGDTCDLAVRLGFKASKRLKSNEVATGNTATVVLTIADNDTFSKDDIIVTRTYTFDEGERIELFDRFCANLKRDVGKKSEVYAKVQIRASFKGLGPFLLDYRATVKTPTIKVKTVE